MMHSDKAILSALCAAATTAALGTLAYATLSAQSQIFGRTMQAPALPNQLALTFDDGPNPSATPRLLEILARHKVRATFFVIGDFVLKEPGLTREIAAAGHVLGNHTMTHPFLPRRSVARIRAELAECSAALEETIGTPVKFFRPPHGALRPVVLRTAREMGLETVQWNLIVGDWKADSESAILESLERGIARNRRRGRGTNVVLHDGGQAGLGQPRLRTVEAVERLLDRLPPETEFVVPQGDGWSGALTQN